MKTAVLRGFRPTTLTNRRQPHSRWSAIDFVLLEALQILQDETSQTTGLPTWLTRADDGTVEFDVREGLDRADAALAEYDKAAKGPKGDKSPPPGAIRYIVPITVDGRPVPEGGLERERLLIAAMKSAKSATSVLPGSDLQIERKRPTGGYDTSQYG